MQVRVKKVRERERERERGGEWVERMLCSLVCVSERERVTTFMYV